MSKLETLKTDIELEYRRFFQIRGRFEAVDKNVSNVKNLVEMETYLRKYQELLYACINSVRRTQVLIARLNELRAQKIKS